MNCGPQYFFWWSAELADDQNCSFILVLHSPQAAVVNARERLSCHRKERQKDEFRKHILKIRFILQELSNLQHG